MAAFIGICHDSIRLIGIFQGRRCAIGFVGRLTDVVYVNKVLLYSLT